MDSNLEAFLSLQETETCPDSTQLQASTQVVTFRLSPKLPAPNEQAT